MVAPERGFSGQPDSRPTSVPRSLLELGLRGPTLGVLQRQGILAVEQLVRMTPDELMGMRRVGLSRMLEIRQALQTHGLDLTTVEAGPAVRIWGFSRRVRLTCCESGECTLDLKTSGASPDDLNRVMTAFVAAHRGCARLGGREPTLTTTDTTRPTPFAAEGTLRERDADEGPRQVRSA